MGDEPVNELKLLFSHLAHEKKMAAIAKRANNEICLSHNIMRKKCNSYYVQYQRYAYCLRHTRTNSRSFLYEGIPDNLSFAV